MQPLSIPSDQKVHRIRLGWAGHRLGCLAWFWEVDLPSPPPILSRAFAFFGNKAFEALCQMIFDFSDVFGSLSLGAKNIRKLLAVNQTTTFHDEYIIFSRSRI